MAFTIAYASNDRIKPVDPNIYSIPEKNIDGFSTPVSNLPASVQIIEDEAFEGTAITNIVLPEDVTTIGERAFAKLSGLRAIKIPMATSYIAKTAFSESNGVIIIAAPDSYARNWAQENRKNYASIEVIYANVNAMGNNSTLSSIRASKDIDIASSESEERYSDWHKLDIFQSKNNIEIIANYVQGRAPPKS